MFRHANKLFWLIFLIGIASCNNEQRELREKRLFFQQHSLQHVGNKEYISVFQGLRDSVNDWKNNGLGYYIYLGKSINYQIDSLLCFNTEKTKFIGVLLKQQLLKTGVQDDIEYIYGVKIKNDWYFFAGATIVLPREYYQKDIHTPLSFEKLHEIAMKEVFSGYLKKNPQGQWEVNEDFFRDLTSVAWCTDCKSQAQWDSAYFFWIKRNWERK